LVQFLGDTTLIELTQGLCKARIWIGELPDSSYTAVDVLERQLEAHKPEITKQQDAAIEMLIPTGPRALYGLLGASFKPNHSMQLVIQVAITDRVQQLLDWSLAKRVDEVHIGLPMEYSESVFQGVLEGSLSRSGILRFDQAAHGVVGSNSWMFRHLAKLITQHFTYEEEGLLEQDVLTFLAQLYNP
jgi:hypothetical protein